jgi:hypothetical protein
MPTVGLPMMPWEVSAATGIGHCNSFPPVCFGAWQRARENGCKGFRTTSGASSALHDRLGPGRASLLRCFHSRHRTASLHFGFDQAHLPPRRCSRQCPHIHALHAGFAQYARAFAQGGAGGHHVIEQGDMRGQLAAGFDCEGVAQVASTCARIKAALGLGAADPVQCVGMQRQTQGTRQRLGQFQSLVVAALAQAAFMQGHAQQGSR